MNIWAAWLADLPASLQRAIAAHQRISLPRGCDAATRLTRLRAGLCHARTVRETYFAQPPEVQEAMQVLRELSRGLTPEDLEARFGPLRAPTAMLKDRRPQSLAEQLVLLGWLLPRLERPHHPLRYLVPPEVRAWLPMPLVVVDDGPAPNAVDAPIVRVVGAVLLACLAAPQPLRQDGTLRTAALRQIMPRLPPLEAASVEAMAELLLPLLFDLGLIAPHNGAATLLPAGRRFLDRMPDTQLTLLLTAWVRTYRPDPWALAVLDHQSDLEWPGLRRRLWAWATALPPGRWLDPGALFPALFAAFGPLADPFTHGLRILPSRTPWSRKRMEQVWTEALQGPLTWFGLIGWKSDLPRRCFVTDLATRCDPATDVALPDDAPLALEYSWRYGAPGELMIPHAAGSRGLALLSTYAVWQSADAEQTLFCVTPQQCARAQAQGEPMAAFDTLLEQQAGPPPDAWRLALPPPAPTIRLVYAAVAIADVPATLERLAQQRSVRRYLETRLAPGIALVDPARVSALTRVLERTGHIVHNIAPPPQQASAPLSPAECAALLELCRFYRRQGSPVPLAINLSVLEDRLRAGLPPASRLASTATEPIPLSGQAEGDTEWPAPSVLLPTIRHAIERCQTLVIGYATAGTAPPASRRIRPLRLERHGRYWYLEAYCLSRRAERMFRVDRIASLIVE